MQRVLIHQLVIIASVLHVRSFC